MAGTLCHTGVLLRIASAVLVERRPEVEAVQTRTRTRRPLRTVRRVGFAALGGFVVWILLGLVFFVFPQTGPVPQHADAVVVLGPPVPQRLAVADRLLRDGVVDTMLVSVPGYTIPSEIAPTCATAHVICARPVPETTRGEGRLLRRYAEEQGWRSVVVVTMGSHVSRSRMIMGRCFDGPITMLASGEPPFRGWEYQYAYQTAATVKAWLLPGC